MLIYIKGERGADRICRQEAIQFVIIAITQVQNQL